MQACGCLAPRDLVQTPCTPGAVDVGTSLQLPRTDALVRRSRDCETERSFADVDELQDAATEWAATAKQNKPKAARATLCKTMFEERVAQPLEAQLKEESQSLRDRVSRAVSYAVDDQQMVLDGVASLCLSALDEQEDADGSSASAAAEMARIAVLTWKHAMQFIWVRRSCHRLPRSAMGLAHLRGSPLALSHLSQPDCIVTVSMAH